MLEISLGERLAFEPAEEVQVGVGWKLLEAATSIELRVVWNTSGKGTQDVEVVHRELFEFPSAEDSRRPTLRLPREPYSFSGRLVSVMWALELVALPSGASTRQEIVIAPGGQEVLATGHSD